MKSRYTVIPVVAMFLLMLLPMQSMTAEEAIVEDSMVELDEGEEIVWMDKGNTGNFVTRKTTVTYYWGGVRLKVTDSEWRNWMRIASVVAQSWVTIRWGMIVGATDESYYTTNSHATNTQFSSYAWYNSNEAEVSASGSFVTDLPDSVSVSQQQSQSFNEPVSVSFSLQQLEQSHGSQLSMQQEQQSFNEPVSSQQQPLGEWTFSLYACASYWV